MKADISAREVIVRGRVEGKIVGREKVQLWNTGQVLGEVQTQRLSIEEGGNAPKLGGLAVYIAWMGQTSYPTAVNIARKLRAAGLSVELPPEEMKFKKSLGLADKLGARYAVIIGEDEVASRIFTLKRLADGDQKKLAEAELLEYLESERRR